MKFGNKIQFNISAVQNGQKSATLNAAPQLTASSTLGKFVITAPVSKALNIAVGEHIQFHNNIQAVEAAIQARTAEIVALAEENGIDINTAEGEAQLLEGLTQWFIAKGIKQYDAKGNPVMASVRYTKEDKQAYLDAHAMEIVEANREALVEQFGELTDEEYAASLTIDMVESPKYHASTGSKTATTGNATGVGCQLNFTDTAIWGALKADLGDNATRKNRVFDVDTAHPVKTVVNNGKEDVEVLAYPINFVDDVDPVVRGSKEA